MKNHYKIHARHYDDDYDHEQADTLTPPVETGDTTTTSTPAFKSEMINWLRSDFDDFNLDSSSNAASDRVTRNMRKLRVEDGKDEDEWIHVE